jgi:hypothetical protein
MTSSGQDEPETRIANVQADSSSPDSHPSNKRNCSTSASSTQRYAGDKRQQSHTRPSCYDFFPSSGFQEQRGFDDQHLYDRRSFAPLFDAYGDHRFHGNLGFRDGRVGIPNRYL